MHQPQTELCDELAILTVTGSVSTAERGHHHHQRTLLPVRHQFCNAAAGMLQDIFTTCMQTRALCERAVNANS